MQPARVEVSVPAEERTSMSRSERGTLRPKRNRPAIGGYASSDGRAVIGLTRQPFTFVLATIRPHKGSSMNVQFPLLLLTDERSHRALNALQLA